MKRQREKPPSGCYDCKGTGRIPDERQCKDPQTGLMVTVYAQANCDCPRGRWRAQQMRKREYQR